MHFSLGQLLQAFGRSTYQRGLDYDEDGKVLSVESAGADLIESTVRGSHGQAYTQRIQCTVHANQSLTVVGHCTCPVNFNCKHVAAALIHHARSAQDAPAPAAPAWSGPAPASGAPRLALPGPLADWVGRVAGGGAPVGEAPARMAKTSRGTVFRLLFALTPFMLGRTRKLGLTLCKARLRSGGEIAAAEPIWDVNRLLFSPPSYIDASDDEPLRLLSAIRGAFSYGSHTEPQGRLGGQLLQMLLADGKLYWAESTQELVKGGLLLLQLGATRGAVLTWQQEGNLWRLAWQLTDPHGGGAAPIHMLETEPLLYVQGAACGEIEPAVASGMPAPRLRELVRQAPPVDDASREALSRQLLAHGLQEVIPPPQSLQEFVRDDVPMRPVLILGAFAQGAGKWIDAAVLAFEYGGIVCQGRETQLVRHTTQGVERIVRQSSAEQGARTRLAQIGFAEPYGDDLAALDEALVLPSQASWLRFAREDLALLAQEGWRIEKRPEYRYNLVEVDDWYAEVEEAGSAWFDLELGIVVGGQRVSLLPVLVELIRAAPEEFDALTIAEHADHEEMLAHLPGGSAVALPWGRINPILNILGELYFSERAGSALRLPTMDAARLAELEGAAQLRWLGGERLRKLGEKIRSFGGVQAIAKPNGFRAELRAYQSEGLAWLQFLREYEMAGILADDMGLGKTLQTLAHILAEKEAGRLSQPALVVAPTSLMGNWQDETARFAPDLRVLLLHGKDRAERFGEIAQADLVLTTYALLPRDEAVLREQRFHLVILDEAHYIKNAQSKAAQVAGLIPARHRLCLTGTPLENHLGELWSQFHFLMPGLLGDDRSFNRDFRGPIEKHGDDTRRRLLMRRLKPFILRRTKDQVARELPPKTEMVRAIEIGGAQRDLYETVRLAMDKKVRDEIAKKGVARSQIVILDALLKLRQVCCDPRLLKTAGKKANAPSAKLLALMEMLDSLLEDGRRILVFSQFTSMLALIEAELHARRIPYALLTGDTVDRAGAVRSFQEGKVPLFLISLKAGGVGLNLTAADTVIHYDPWWNPAAENQATDRAWRIGQDKPVFVYKLIAKGTLEEKIQALQQKKSDLAHAILGGGDTRGVKLTPEDLQGIFEPLDA